MFKLIILFSLFLGVASAKSRFSDEDKKKFIEEVKLSIAEHKLENKGKVDLQIIKPGLNLALEDYLKREKFTRQEMLYIKQKYEVFSKDPSITPDKAEEAFYKFIQNELDEISKKALMKTARGEVCNTWGCEEGLKCAPDPIQLESPGKKKRGQECKENSECTSQECVEEKIGSKKKICEDIFRCYQPLQLKESCDQNPVCGEGSCLPINYQTAGIGECEVIGKSCKKNLDCCSDSCVSNICQSKKICKDCLGNGAIPQRGQVCCEGLYKNLKGVCVPAVPPSVIPQVRVKPTYRIFFNKALNIIISEASAESDNGNPDPGGVSTGNSSPPPPAPSPAELTKAEMKNEITSDRDKYENFEAKRTEEAEVVDPKKVVAQLNFSKKSNFETCEMNFKEDFFADLKQKGKFDSDVAMLAYDFMLTGDSEPDYWLDRGRAGTSLFARMKAIGLKSRDNRKLLFSTINGINIQMRCACLDVKGYNKLEKADDKKYFETSCPAEFDKYKATPTGTAGGSPLDNENAAASGLKGKRMMKIWTTNLVAFYTRFAALNLQSEKDFTSVLNWTQGPEAKWNDYKTKSYDLFAYNVKNPNNSSAGLGGLLGAVLAAGIIAILGGFASASILTTWASIGIISVSAVTGAGGMWMIASLKGAWISHRPEITDYKVQPRTYSCGKKDSCTEYTRTLLQPYNEICKIHTGANACLKNFVVVTKDNKPRYIVDPWVPVGVSRSSVYMNQPLYTEKLETGFLNAKAEMLRRNPGATGGGGKKGGGEFVAQEYMSEVFIEATLLGKYAPDLTQESIYTFSDDKIKKIKDAAKEFAVSEGFLLSTDTENLESFANYAYEFHFLWPKMSYADEIGYPTVGLLTYLEFMAVDVTGGGSTNLANSATAAAKLNLATSLDYDRALKLYADTELATNLLNPAQQAVIKQELANSQSDVNNALTLNALLNNKNLDSELSKLSPGFLADQSKLAGANAVANLTNDQKSLLRTVGSLRNIRKDQLKSLDAYNKAVAASGDKDRAARMGLAAKKFSDRFSGANGAIGANASMGLSKSDDSEADKKKGALGADYSGFNNGAFGANNQNGSVSLFGSSSTSGSKSSSGASEGGSDVDKNSSNANDRKLIAEAIDARNSSKGKYDSNEDLTLFEKVTNAYIRNYDKILTKKKDKDITDQKE